MNIALIMVDTLRADHADSLYHEAQKQGWTTAKATSPDAWTLPSHISMITGLSHHGVDESAPPSQDAKRSLRRPKSRRPRNPRKGEKATTSIPPQTPTKLPTSAPSSTTTYTSYADGKPPQRSIIFLFSAPIVATKSADVLAGDLSNTSPEPLISLDLYKDLHGGSSCSVPKSRENKKKEWVWGYGQVARVVKSTPYL